MEYFKEPVVAIFIRDVTKEVANFALSKITEDKKTKVMTMQYSNENVAQEMFTPLSSIILQINLLLALSFSPQE